MERQKNTKIITYIKQDVDCVILRQSPILVDLSYFLDYLYYL